MGIIFGLLLFLFGMWMLFRSIGWFGWAFETFSNVMDAFADLIEGIAYFLTNIFYGRHNGEIVFLEQYSKRQVCAGIIQTLIWGALLLGLGRLFIFAK